MEDTIHVTPTPIRRVLPASAGGETGTRVQLVDVPAGNPEGSERALLVL